MKLVFATNNQHKLAEIQQIVGDEIEILSLSDIGCHDDIPETADTLEGNALQKARWVKEKYGYDCFADDTGLMVDALGGAPGVYSARFAGPGCTPDDNIDLLLQRLRGVEAPRRSARFATVISLILGDNVHTFRGSVEGSISTDRHGEGGFGYDPVFFPEGSSLSFAQMSAADKNAISHRGRATAKLTDFLTSLHNANPKHT